MTIRTRGPNQKLPLATEAELSAEDEAAEDAAMLQILGLADQMLDAEKSDSCQVLTVQD